MNRDQFKRRATAGKCLRNVISGGPSSGLCSYLYTSNIPVIFCLLLYGRNRVLAIHGLEVTSIQLITSKRNVGSYACHYQTTGS